jgi:hypothetical protein
MSRLARAAPPLLFRHREEILARHLSDKRLLGAV